MGSIHIDMPHLTKRDQAYRILYLNQAVNTNQALNTRKHKCIWTRTGVTYNIYLAVGKIYADHRLKNCVPIGVKSIH